MIDPEGWVRCYQFKGYLGIKDDSAGEDKIFRKLSRKEKNDLTL